MKRRDVLPRVTDHAVLRWLERVHGIDVEVFRQEIREHCREGVALGAQKVRLSKTEFVIVDQTVVTVQRREGSRHG